MTDDDDDEDDDGDDGAETTYVNEEVIERASSITRLGNRKQRSDVFYESIKLKISTQNIHLSGYPLTMVATSYLRSSYLR